MVVGSTYGIIIINSETVAKINFSQFYRKKFFKIFLDVFMPTVNNRLQRAVTLLRPFQETFRIPNIKKNRTKYVPNWDHDDIMTGNTFGWATMFTLCNLNFIKCLCKECENVENISKKTYALRNIISRVFRIVELVLTSSVSSA